MINSPKRSFCKSALSIKISFTYLFLFIILEALAGGIKGKISSDEEKPLPFASIYITETGSGTTSNSDGFYQINLQPGKYQIVYQYIGYATEVRSVTVDKDFMEISISLKPQVILLKDVVVKAGKEDPAYTIMRKAIAKAKFHTHAVDSYQARVYLKGSGKLKDYPWLLKKRIEKEGVKKNQVYVVESLSEIEYERPNNLKEKVISIRSDGRDNNTIPNQFIFGSFYQPKVAGFISPLSPKAFSYYKYEYLGSFQDREYFVNRIKVTPRSKGEDVVEGVIYLVDDLWSLHSLELVALRAGMQVKVKTLYAPVEAKAWLPVSQKFDITGKLMGFDFDYNYLATISNYKVKMNPDLYVEKMRLVDDKLNKVLAKDIEQNGKKNQQLKERVEAGNEVTRKELKSLIKEYEKEERKKQPEPDVIASRSFSTDSMAFKKNADYWETVRPVPLTKEEAKGYEQWDSLAVAKRDKWKQDSIKAAKNRGFQAQDLLFGDRYKLNTLSAFRLSPLDIQFNTVEGYNLNSGFSYSRFLKDTTGLRISISPVVRYAFARKQPSGYLNLKLDNTSFAVDLEGGRYVQQFNTNAINPTLNSLTTLLLEQNFMKLYERDYAQASFRGKVNNKIRLSTSWSFSQRRELQNSSNYKLIDRDKIEGYSSNSPFSLELPDTHFQTHKALIGEVGLDASPWIRFWKRNGEMIERQGSSPKFTLLYRKGFKEIMGSDVDFDQVEVGAKYQFLPFTRGKLDVSLTAGAFLKNDRMYFMDYKHFQGNRTPFVLSDPVASFRLLDYYKYSSSGKYLVGSLHYQFREFLFTRIPTIRMMGVKENIFFNFLSTGSTKGFYEAGYAIDGILRIFRLEAVVAFNNGAIINSGLKIGIATNIPISIGRR